MLFRRWLVIFGMLLLPGHIYAATFQADTSSVEWIKAYFNMPADYSKAFPGNMSNSSQDLIGTLESLIHSAEHSVDLAIYDLEHPRIGRALAEVRRRGVHVRIVTDNYNRTDSGEIDSTMWATLQEAGIISIDDDGDVYQADGTIVDHSLVNSGADMHHKFAVIDGRNSDPNDDIVWTGSTNLTYTGAFNTNNVIVIKDSGIAEAYQSEFDQMWGGTGDKPDPLEAKYHKDKQQVSEHIYFVGNTKVELYFSPINRQETKPSIMERLVELIHDEVQHNIAFQAFAITSDIPLSRTIWEISATEDIQLNGIIDPLFYYRYRNNGDIWGSAEAQLDNRMILPANEMRKLHHKVMLLDAENPDPEDRGVTIAGSYNFSKNAEVNNDENLLIIHSDRITNQFYQDFSGVERRARGESEPPALFVDSNEWHPVKEVSDGSEFAIEILPGFNFGVRFLGVNVPRIYAANDSSEFYSAEAAEYLRNVISGGEVQLKGASGREPRSAYGAFQSYVTLKKGGEEMSLNRHLLEQGFGQYSRYYAQHPDSVAAFKEYARLARDKRKGIWKYPEKIGERVPRAEVVDDATDPSDAFPININSADKALLQLLPGIGPAYAERIISYRKENGRFTDVEQLRNINGIGPKTMDKLRANIVID